MQQRIKPLTYTNLVANFHKYARCVGRLNCWHFNACVNGCTQLAAVDFLRRYRLLFTCQIIICAAHGVLDFLKLQMHC